MIYLYLLVYLWVLFTTLSKGYWHVLWRAFGCLEHLKYAGCLRLPQHIKLCKRNRIFGLALASADRLSLHKSNAIVRFRMDKSHRLVPYRRQLVKDSKLKVTGLLRLKIRHPLTCCEDRYKVLQSNYLTLHSVTHFKHVMHRYTIPCTIDNSWLRFSLRS